VICSFRGVMVCRKCVEGKTTSIPLTPEREIPLIDWPEH
jgi:hypothetical protein